MIIPRTGACSVLLDAARPVGIGPDRAVRSAPVIVTEAGNQVFPVTIRYAWPSELDLMARLAGFELGGRWSSWSCEPFSSASTGHISVWRKTG